MLRLKHFTMRSTRARSRHHGPPIGSLGPQHLDLRLIAPECIELHNQRTRRVRHDDRVARRGISTAPRCVGLISPTPQRNAMLCRCAGDRSARDHMVDVVADPGWTEQQPTVRLLQSLLDQASDRIVQPSIGRRRPEQLIVFVADPAAVRPTSIDRIGQRRVLNVGADPQQSSAIFFSAALDRSRPETAACVVPVSNRRQCSARISGEDSEYRNGVAIGDQRCERSTCGYHCIVEMWRNGQHWSVGPENPSYHFAAGQLIGKSRTS